MDPSINVLGEELILCGGDPATGIYRDGLCNTCKEDVGSHTVCIKTTADFLAYSKAKGNDLSTPMPEHDFPGLKAGDNWCLCAGRWLEAYRDQKAPKVYLTRTHHKALTIVPMALLKHYALDLN